jgi:alpha-tubulin suppressor-like RCC1 family protein
VELPRRVVDVSANSHAVYALLEDGTVWSWGYNNGGQLGSGKKEEKGHPLPDRIPSLSGMVAIASSSGGSAVAQDGSVVTWGVSAAAPPPSGPLLRHDLWVPYKLPFKAKVPLRQLVGGYALVDADGKVYFWKGNHLGQRGTGEQVDEPSQEYWITPEQSLWSYN